MEVSIVDDGLEIVVNGVYGSDVPTDPEKNTAGIVCQLVMGRMTDSTGLRLVLNKGVKPGYGLGSSGASAAAVALALNALFHLDLSWRDLIALASQGEVASAGVPHADNVSPALLGGFTIVRSYHPLDVIRIKPPQNLGVAVGIPRFSMTPNKTWLARSILPQHVSIGQMVHEVGNASALVAGLMSGDIALVGRSMNDLVVEPVRAKLIPGYRSVKQRAERAGAAGVAISGAGPAMLAIADKSFVNMDAVAEAMEEGFAEAGVRADSYISSPGRAARLLGANDH